MKDKIINILKKVILFILLYFPFFIFIDGPMLLVKICLDNQYAPADEKVSLIYIFLYRFNKILLMIIPILTAIVLILLLSGKLRKSKIFKVMVDIPVIFSTITLGFLYLIGRLPNIEVFNNIIGIIISIAIPIISAIIFTKLINKFFFEKNKNKQKRKKGIVNEGKKTKEIKNKDENKLLNIIVKIILFVYLFRPLTVILFPVMSILLMIESVILYEGELIQDETFHLLEKYVFYPFNYLLVAIFLIILLSGKFKKNKAVKYIIDIIAAIASFHWVAFISAAILSMFDDSYRFLAGSPLTVLLGILASYITIKLINKYFFEETKEKVRKKDK